MSTFVDTSVWSLAMRRDAPDLTPEVAHLRWALRSDDADVRRIAEHHPLRVWSG